MRKKHFLFAALFLAALVFGFSACENPNGDLLNNGGSITDNDSTTNNPDQGGDNNGGNSERPVPDISSTLVATGAATDVEYSSVTLWGRINTDTLWAFPNVKWGIEYAMSKNNVIYHTTTTKKICTTELQGMNADEYSVALAGLEGGKMLYYNAYLLINDIKYIYGEVDSVRLLSRLTVNSNNDDYGTVSGSGDYAFGDEATITATATGNYYFTSWSDGNTENPRTVVVNSDTTFTANFTLKPYLTVNTNNTSYGTVTGSGYYMPGDEVTITATPKFGFEFVEWNDGNTDNPRIITMGNADVTYTATFEVIPMVIAGTENGYDYVDLGLSVKWATCNVGATSPEEYGNYYAWGETEPKTTYDLATYKWCNGSESTLTKYNTSRDYGRVDNKTVLDLADDAARANWGGAWRMPTDAEWTELRENCIWTRTDDYNGTGVAGRIVTSITNGNHIFLPAAGYRGSGGLNGAGGYGYYWSSSLNLDDPNNAWRVYFDSDYVYRRSYDRNYGLSVRPVLGE